MCVAEVAGVSAESHAAVWRVISRSYVRRSRSLVRSHSPINRDGLKKRTTGSVPWWEAEQSDCALITRNYHWFHASLFPVSHPVSNWSEGLFSEVTDVEFKTNNCCTIKFFMVMLFNPPSSQRAHFSDLYFSGKTNLCFFNFTFIFIKFQSHFQAEAAQCERTLLRTAPQARQTGIKRVRSPQCISSSVNVKFRFNEHASTALFVWCHTVLGNVVLPLLSSSFK